MISAASWDLNCRAERLIERLSAIPRSTLALGVPGGKRRATLVNEPFPEREDEARLLGEGDEGIRAQEALLGVAPADQGLGLDTLDADEALADRREEDFGLVVERELVAQVIEAGGSPGP